MKKLILILVLMLPMASLAQSNKKAVNKKRATTQRTVELPGFKVFGIGFETTREKYEQELSKKGYKNPSKFGNYDEYIVDFAGHKNSRFSIHYNVVTDSITYIKILFPYETYKQNSEAHYDIVRQLDSKYGKSERKDALSEIFKELGEYNHGQVENKWEINGIEILAIFYWHSESDKIGDNWFCLNYYTNASNSTEIKPSDDL